MNARLWVYLGLFGLTLFFIWIILAVLLLPPPSVVQHDLVPIAAQVLLIRYCNTEAIEQGYSTDLCDTWRPRVLADYAETLVICFNNFPDNTDWFGDCLEVRGVVLPF